MHSGKTVNCPICDAVTIFGPDNPDRPFCSERCKLIDLGEWFKEERRIAGGEKEDDDGAETPPGGLNSIN